MPQFLLFCRDKPDALALRKETRAAHLEYFKSYGNKLVLGGPMLDEAGSPSGSLLLIEAANAAEAREISANDPYFKAGVFARVDVIPFTTVILNPPKAD